ncbi:DNA alkylation repair protein [Methanobacterium aggregans]|uniref:DNA alkylation repair protein n=1 Tax=Methanobacterium aggregans TaxID=1615586 RepID=UPI001AE817C9|nr:DNA alkylation repair protein [Methanobacterium aggregans]MBP2045875.1 3-methyladenine DNA glycosylase AlkD [Methanobacterium aggregans]
MEYDYIIHELESLSKPEEREGMARFGISPKRTYAVRMPEIRRIARKVGKDHELAARLWDADYRETKIMASIVDDPKLVTEGQMESWAAEFDYWEICDQCCINLFRKTPYAYKKAFQWSLRDEEFVKRAGFALIAVLAVHDKKAPDDKMEDFFPPIIRESKDNRKYVKKAVNWALRQIGKRNKNLNKRAIEVAEEIKSTDSKSAKWIAADALRELRDEKLQKKLI